MSEYGDPISAEQIELAVEGVLDLRRAAPERSLDDQVRTAVAQTICACVLAIEDDLEGHISGSHTAIVDEVKRQVVLRLAGPSKHASNSHLRSFLQ